MDGAEGLGEERTSRARHRAKHASVALASETRDLQDRAETVDEDLKENEKAKKLEMQVNLRCPDCGHDFEVKGSVDRHKFYECPRCTYEFSLGFAIH